MKRINFNGDEETHNFWQNYTDLLAGLLIVFIIISMAMLVFYNNLEKELNDSKKYQGEIEILSRIKNELGVSKVDETVLNKIIEDRKLFKKVEAFYETMENIENNSTYFHYNKQFKRLECKILGPMFESNSDKIIDSYKDDLRKAGQELDENILTNINDSLIGIKVIIDGRVARYMDEAHKNNPMPDPENAASTSYRRAKALFNLWREAGHLSSIEKRGEIFFSGSGYGGQGRYSGVDEELNRRFIIEIIPFIRY
ncbi:MAG: hypothetical protein MJY63_00090 [Paludibacteraceae bacterium]|nr:hypothetical protein [Paludibacteraceae bacterium]